MSSAKLLGGEIKSREERERMARKRETERQTDEFQKGRKLKLHTDRQKVRCKKTS